MILFIQLTFWKNAVILISIPKSSMNGVDDFRDRFSGVMILSAESRKYSDEGIGWDARQLRYCDEFVSKCLMLGKIVVIRDRVPYLLPIPGHLEALFRTGMSEWNSKSDTSKRDEFRSLKSSSIKMFLPALSVAGFFIGKLNPFSWSERWCYMGIGWKSRTLPRCCDAERYFMCHWRRSGRRMPRGSRVRIQCVTRISWCGFSPAMKIYSRILHFFGEKQGYGCFFWSYH